MEENPTRIEAIRLLGQSEKLLHTRDLNGARDFAALSRETDPSLEGADQILSIIDVLIAANKRVNNHPDWYSILQVDRRSEDLDLIKKQYRRFALQLHPDKNKFAFADQAFKLVADAWAVLSNNSKKSHYDRELGFFTRVDLSANRAADQSVRVPVRRAEPPVKIAQQQERNQMATFWTACPYCYRLFEYPKTYEGCCMRCPICERSFDAVRIPALPPLVPGKEAYYCCWAFFPLGFVPGNPEAGQKAEVPAGFPNWMPPMFASPQPPPEVEVNGSPGGGAAAAPPLVTTIPATAAPSPVTIVPEAAPPPASVTTVPTATVTPSPTVKKTAGAKNTAAAMPSVTATGSTPRKRGRPRKNPIKI